MNPTRTDRLLTRLETILHALCVRMEAEDAGFGDSTHVHSAFVSVRYVRRERLKKQKAELGTTEVRI